MVWYTADKHINYNNIKHIYFFSNTVYSTLDIQNVIIYSLNCARIVYHELKTTNIFPYTMALSFDIFTFETPTSHTQLKRTSFLKIV